MESDAIIHSYEEGLSVTSELGDISSVSERSLPLESLTTRQVRSVYLITYSQADLEVVPTREEFSRLVLDSFANADPLTRSEVLQWVCCREVHRTGGLHYHMAVKLNSRRRWLKVRNYLDARYGVKVNFSSNHFNYYSAWQYTTKEDQYYVQSVNHPDLANAAEPSTSEASSSRATADRSSAEDEHTVLPKRKKARKSLSIYDVSQIAVEKGIKNRLELLALANQQKREGKTDLAQLIANRGGKAVDEALSVGWELEKAEEKLERSRLTRIEILYRQLGEECVIGCNRRWLQMAEDVLLRNNIKKEDFSEAIRNALEKGRGKYRNVYLKGPTNCAKTFLLNPLNTIYHTFCNPASTTFAWVGADEAEVLFLNDFRWSANIIPWHDFLLLLEGQEVHLPAPKTHFKQDISFKGDTPIFCTAKDEIALVRAGVLDDRETEMMRVRWRIFSLYPQIAERDQVNVQPCCRCFSELILQSSDN